MLAAIAYGIWYWQGKNDAAAGPAAHAESACRDAIRRRYDLSRVSVTRVTENSNGFTVRASGTLDNGGSARLVCLTSRNGTVRDLTIEHH